MNLQHKLEQLTAQLDEATEQLSGELPKHDYELVFQRKLLLEEHIQTIKQVLGV
ncbi:hypothetical protein [Vibrio fortis]|uniref:hypothetical protein n=1 Tax=Vibrio fortis TaxID=212667 RepID=UPI0038CD57A8